MLKKYSKYKNDIRVHGNSGDKIGSKEYLKKDDNGNPYVDCYHIDTKEGLIYFLTEYDYYCNQVVYTEKLRKKLYRKQKEIIADVNEKMLEKANPYITTEQWLEQHCMKETGNFEYTEEILKYVKEFDSVINPFSGKYNMKKPIDYVDNVILNLYYDCTNSIRMRAKNDKYKLVHSRDAKFNDDFLTYTFYYDIDSNLAMEIHNYISSKENQNVICLYSYRKNSSKFNYDYLDLRYDLLSNQAYATYGDKASITFEQKELLISELKRAIEEAKKFTIKNMTKK